LIEVNIFQLIDAFGKVIERRLPGAQLRFQLDKLSVKDSMKLIIQRLMETNKIYFSQLFEKQRTVSEFVITFLALLELVHLGVIKIYQINPEDDIHIQMTEENPDPDELIEKITDNYS